MQLTDGDRIRGLLLATTTSTERRFGIGRSSVLDHLTITL